MKNLLFFLIALSAGLIVSAQTITIPGNTYAFRYSVNNNFGMYFNETDASFDLRNGSATGIFQIDANNGNFKTDIKFNTSSDLLIDSDRYAFRYSAAKNYGLFFNATNSVYEFRTANASSIFSIGANTGDLLTGGNVGIGTATPAAKLHVATGKALIGASGGVLSRLTVNASLNEEIFRGRINGVTQFIINAQGEVGIGTATVPNLLTVDGDASFDGPVGIGTTTPGENFHVATGKAAIGDVGGTMAKLTVNASPGEEVMRARTDGTTRFYIGTTGNVGIHSASPSNPLTVNGDADFTGNTGFGTSTPTDKVHINSDAAQNALRVQVNGATKLRVHENGSVSVGSLSQGPANGLYVSGNLHVGTIAGATGYKAAIDGKLICEEVRVLSSGSWPDYVFAADYDLPTITEIEQFIMEKNHLPGVPAAAEIESQGYELAKMDARLLEKIEELTLHLIQLKKDNDAMQVRIQELESSK
ncbi:MAG: hypothetical protein HKN92_11375 [Chitinophagales bacterium]|nr:hypothetical protein [Chitinophagales bacterium]